ncbi:Rv1733c family protein [Mycobacterium sp. Marseille-P9652]|uniref:Rv1733c family protein n=1 Tax=Mycobacterium sp. Marseille-P9652 TaxID=2654950 RepID=UPI0012E75E05|nr:hypothetical protein [Mycobacterium sp. Marseille-P9652]
METFTLDPRRWRVARIVGRNPLLRRTDRVEALVVLAALLASIALVPVSGVVGAVTYGHRQHVYIQEAHERHRVLATVSEVLVVESGTTVVQARWPVASGERGGPVQLARLAKPGETEEIWVDRDGKPALPPTPAWHAVIDAVGMAGVAVLLGAFVMTSLMAAAYARLNRVRYAAWDRDLRSLVEGRTNRP